MRLDLADLRLFLCILDAGSITAGAERAHLALASASERLRVIEADVGVPLFERGRRGVKPTAAGDALAHHARVILGQRERMRVELHEFANGARGTLSLYANTAALTDFLPGRIASWLAQRPHLSLDLRERTSPEIVQAVAGGLIEAGVVSDAVDAQGLVLEHVAPDRLVVLVARQHALASSRRLNFKDVWHEAFVGLAAGNALQDLLDEQARRHGGEFNFRARMKTFEGLSQLVAAGVGVAIVPEPVARRLRRNNPVRAVPLADDWAQRNLCLCYRSRAELSGPMQALLAHLAGREASALASQVQHASL